jgi:hypothetical protein
MLQRNTFLPSSALLAPSCSSFPCFHITYHVQMSSCYEDGRSSILQSRETYRSAVPNVPSERCLHENRHENLISLICCSAVSQCSNRSRTCCLAEADSRGFLSAQHHSCLPLCQYGNPATPQFCYVSHRLISPGNPTRQIKKLGDTIFRYKFHSKQIGPGVL